MLELNDLDLQMMFELNPDLKNVSSEEMINKMILLKNINCSLSQIKNIISCNSFLFNSTDEEIDELIKYLKDKGFTCLNVLFDSNPYILNLEIYEIDNYINNRINNGESLKNIVDDLYSNPYLFNEI